MFQNLIKKQLKFNINPKKLQKQINCKYFKFISTIYSCLGSSLNSSIYICATYRQRKTHEPAQRFHPSLISS
jgi:hypothetical protein